ncbi:hypothetical protein ACSBPQ_05775 [Stenotrophomonas sp. JC08]|uniref:hypothetical protein n=1 Tax=Stenotrophomonas sp. JC08 TaxID=3445779 RepID=UPI003FA2276F
MSIALVALILANGCRREGEQKECGTHRKASVFPEVTGQVVASGIANGGLHSS